MLNRFWALLLIALLTLVAVVAISRIGPNAVESVAAQAAISSINPEIAKVTIENLLSGQGKSITQPIVRRTTVDEKYAIATWQWGEAGGQSILIQQDNRWKVLASGGGAVSLEILKQQGIPAPIAERLMQKEQAAQKH
jgi:glucokinase